MNFLEKSESLTDWYVVEGAPFGIPEGTAQHWRDAIAAIKVRQTGPVAKRLGISFAPDGAVEVYSARNAIGPDDCVVINAGDVTAWIEAAEKLLSETASTTD